LNARCRLLHIENQFGRWRKEPDFQINVEEDGRDVVLSKTFADRSPSYVAAGMSPEVVVDGGELLA